MNLAEMWATMETLLASIPDHDLHLNDVMSVTFYPDEVDIEYMVRNFDGHPFMDPYDHRSARTGHLYYKYQEDHEPLPDL